MPEKPVKRYILPKIYIPKKGDRKLPDILKAWFVYYSHLSPETGKMQRFRLYYSINKFDTVPARMAEAEVVCESIRRLLVEENYTPFPASYHTNVFSSDGASFRTCLNYYLQEKSKQVKPGSLTMMRIRLEKLYLHGAETLGEYFTLSDVTGSFISGFIDGLMASGKIRQPKTANVYKSAFSAFFNFFLAQEGQKLIKENPAKYVTSRRVYKKGNRPYSEEEFRRVLSYTAENSPYLNFMLRFIYYSCMRPGAEIRLCQVKHILGDANPVKRRIQIPAQNAKTGGITGKDQYIPLDPHLYDMLEGEMKIFDYSPDDYIFSVTGTPGPKPININYWLRPVARMKKELSLHQENTLYAAKHTRCCHLFADGESFERIRKLTRHTNNAILQDYLKGLGLAVEDNVVYNSRKI